MTQTLNEDGILLITWENPAPSPKCNVEHYSVTCSTDIDRFRYETSSLSVIIPSNLFCYEINTILEGFIEDYAYAIRTEHFAITNLPPVEDLLLTRLETNVWQVSWTAHRKQVQCDVEYEVTFLNGVDKGPVIIDGSNYTFEVDNCEFVTVGVKAFSGELRSDEVNITKYC